MTLQDDLRAQGLSVLGTCPPMPEDGLVSDIQQLALIGPDEPNFWEVFQASPEYADGQADPMNRWSTRVIEKVAGTYGATALFPFDGPPWRPFIRWALRSETCFSSPVSLLVHSEAGLFVSFRAALALREPMSEITGESPCPTCAAPCKSACPVGALNTKGYDVPACTVHIATDAGQDCVQGCKVRRACPVGQDRRLVKQSAFHMGAFIRSNA